MSGAPEIDRETIGRLDDQQWRRLGITQTFERLLVEAAATSPGPVRQVRDSVGSQLGGGAAKFWELSFDQLKKDLARRGILQEAAGELGLQGDFADRLQRLANDMQHGVSRVEPTPGVTLEDLLQKTKEREDRDKAARQRRERAARAEAGPRKRKGQAAEEAPAAAPAPPPPQEPARPRIAPPNKLFTSQKLNRLLDCLDGTNLLKSQLKERIDLAGADLDHFLEITNALEVTRMSRDDMVELHWKGRELARTSSVDRRMALIDLVRELRAHAEQ